MRSRKGVEPTAAGQVVYRYALDVLRLESLLERDRSLAERDDATLIRANLEFHGAVWEASRNPVLQDLLAQLSRHLVHAPHSTLSVDGRWDEALGEHARLVEAISQRDEEAARAAARSHFETARGIRLDLLRAAALEETTRADEV